MAIIKGYLKRISDALDKSDIRLLDEIADQILATKSTGARIFTVGNGGSAATASHFCNDLMKGCRIDGRPGFSAQCLCDPVPVVTCLGNDFGYEFTFSIQLETFANPGDLLIAFSGSGNSPNVIKAIEFAKKRGLYVIGFGGFDGGKMKDMCDICLVAPTSNMEELEDLHLCYCHALSTHFQVALRDVWDIEAVNYPKKGGFKYALFDFDGTISLLREGWREVMVSYFVEELQKVESKAKSKTASKAASKTSSDKEKETEKEVGDFVDLLTGKQTIFQCIRLKEEIEKRGGTALDPYEYKAEYLRRLMGQIKSRHESIRSGKSKPDDFLVPGGRAFLARLRDSGVKLYLASGTDEVDVKAEADLLDVSQYFNGGIHGAKDTESDCTKEVVIRQILKENNIKGHELISFGDGYVEVELVKNIDGYAVAVATDEERKVGVDPWKRERLLSARADAVIPDFSGTDRLMQFIFGAPPQTPPTFKKVGSKL